MTHPQTPPPVAVTAAPGTRLEQLLASYDSAKAAAQDASDRFEAITNAIKAEIASSVPNGTVSAHLSGVSPGLPRLRMHWLRPWRFDSKRFKQEHPQMYVRYEVRSDGHWELRAE